MLWIADEALQAEDPEGWVQCESPNGDMYYMNPVTQQVLWQHPLDYTYQQKYLQAKAGNLPQGSDSSYKEAKPQAAGHASSKGQHSQQVSSTAVSLPKDISTMSEQVR